MENIRVVVDARVFIGVFVLSVGLLFIPLSLVPSIERRPIAQPGTQCVTEGACPPEISVYLEEGSYRIELGGSFIVAPSTRLKVLDGNSSVVYQSSIDAQRRNEQFTFKVTDPATYIISIEDGAARVELLKLAGQTVWSESLTYPSQPLMIVGIVMAIMGAAILLARRALPQARA